MKKILVLSIIFLVLSCAATSKVKEMPQTQDVVKVKVTKLGEVPQIQKIPFILIPDTMNLEIPDNADIHISVDVINCKQETVAISVATNTSPNWISFTPVFLLKPYEIKKVSFTLMPYKIKNKTSEGEFDIVFSINDFVQNLNIKITLIGSEQIKEENKDLLKLEPNQKHSKVADENVSKQAKIDRKVHVQKKEVEVNHAVLYYTVHIASFKTKEEALYHLMSLPRLEPKTSMVAYDLGKKGVWYRVLIGLYPTLAEASAVAKHFKDFYGFDYALPIKVEEDIFKKCVADFK